MTRRVVQARDIDDDLVEFRVTRDRSGVERRLLVIDGKVERRPTWNECDDFDVALRSPSELRAVAIVLESPYV